MATAEKLVYTHIVKEPGYCGGKAAIDRTRVRVNNVVFLWKEGKTPEEILVEYPDLSLGQVHAALGYYYDNKDEIEAELRRDDDAVARFEAEKAQDLSDRQAR